LNAAAIREIFGRCAAASSVNRGLEPIAAIGEPPARVANRDRRGERPPERKYHIGDEAEDRERDPKYLSLHMSILDASTVAMSRRRAKMFQIVTLPGPTIPVIPK
jgi:hypothetical protein